MYPSMYVYMYAYLPWGGSQSYLDKMHQVQLMVLGLAQRHHKKNSKDI